MLCHHVLFTDATTVKDWTATCNFAADLLCNKTGAHDSLKSQTTCCVMGQEGADGTLITVWVLSPKCSLASFWRCSGILGTPAGRAGPEVSPLLPAVDDAQPMLRQSARVATKRPLACRHACCVTAYACAIAKPVVQEGLSGGLSACR